MNIVKSEQEEIKLRFQNNYELFLNDFKLFFRLMIRKIEKVEPTPLQYEICDFVQNKEYDRIMVQGYRGASKTYVISALVVHILLNDPDHLFIIVSANTSLSSDIMKFIRRIIEELPICAHLRPKKGEEDNALRFSIPGKKASRSPSVQAISITGGMNGNRANTVISDDIEINNNSDTQLMRDKLLRNSNEFNNMLIPGGRIIYLGTPATGESIYKRLPKKGFKIRVWPARIPHIKNLNKYGQDGENLSPTILAKVLSGNHYDEPTNPLMHDDEDLIKREMGAEMGKSNFALHYMLDTSLSDKDNYPLRMSDFIVFECNTDKAPMSIVYQSKKENILQYDNNRTMGDDYFNPPMTPLDKDWREYEDSVMSIDPAGVGQDENGYTIAKFLHGYIYILEVGSLKGGFEEENIIRFANIAKRYGVNNVVFEDNLGGGVLTGFLRKIFTRIYPLCHIEPINVNRQKEKRIIDICEPFMNSHRVILNEQILKDDEKVEKTDYSFIYQLTHINRKPGSLIHDDKLDSFSHALAYFADLSGVDEKEAIRIYQEQRRRDDMFKWASNFQEEGGVEFGAEKNLKSNMFKGATGHNMFDN